MAACARSTVPIGVAARSKRSNTFAVLSSRPTLARSTASSGEWKGRAVCARCARLCASSAEITSAGALALGYSWVNSAVMSASISQSSSSQSLFSGAGGGRGRGRCGAADSTSLCIGGRPPDDDGGRLGGTHTTACERCSSLVSTAAASAREDPSAASTLRSDPRPRRHRPRASGCPVPAAIQDSAFALIIGETSDPSASSEEASRPNARRRRPRNRRPRTKSSTS